MRLNGLSVVERTAATARGLLRVSADEPFFKGHFPSYPLVPGVVLIEAAVQVAGGWNQGPSRLAKLEEARFYDEVRPDDAVDIHLKRQGASFVGEVRRGEKLCATMSFTLEATP